MELVNEPIGRLEQRASEAFPQPIPDFSRPAFCILGLTFDNIEMDAALSVVREAVRTRRRCVISTPNLNFVVRAASDAEFRASVVRSDISLIDGMPLVWAGRWSGVFVKGRVSGADLFERLRASREPSERLTVYLFGGPEGVARLAADRLNAEDGGLRCVGYCSPGFGSVEDISSPEIIRKINASGADFLLVALGAQKGLLWIERNKAALRVPIISHLGAVINFTAGTIRRAPVRVQRAGLEWLWRIYREPELWRRYFADGAKAIALTAETRWNAWMARIPAPRRLERVPTIVEVTESDDEVTIRVGGAWSAACLDPLRAVLQTRAGSHKRLLLDLGGATALDSGTVALFLLLRQHRLDAGQGWHVTGASPRLARMCRSYGAGDLLG